MKNHELRYLFMFIKTRNETNKIIFIATNTEPNETLTTQDIERRDRNKGSLTIGSHYVVQPDGLVETGRPLDQFGQRRRKYNKDSVFVDVVGKYSKYTDAQLQAISEIEDELLDLYPGSELIDLV